MTVVLSSHLVADLERVCDYIIQLAASRVQLCGDIDTVVARAPDPGRPPQGHHGDRARPHRRAGHPHRGGRPRCSFRARGPVADPAFQASDVSLEEIVLAYMGQGPARTPRRGLEKANDMARLAH